MVAVLWAVVEVGAEVGEVVNATIRWACDEGVIHCIFFKSVMHILGKPAASIFCSRPIPNPVRVFKSVTSFVMGPGANNGDNDDDGVDNEDAMPIVLLDWNLNLLIESSGMSFNSSSATFIEDTRSPFNSTRISPILGSLQLDEEEEGTQSIELLEYSQDRRR